MGFGVFDDRSDSAFCHAVELMNVRRARRVLDRLRVQKLLELVGMILTSVVGVERAHLQVGAGLCHQGSKSGRVFSDSSERIALLLEKVYVLESGVVVDEDESVLVVSDGRSLEGTYDVGVNEAANVGRLVHVRRGMLETSGVGFHAVRARAILCTSYVARSIFGAFAQ